MAGQLDHSPANILRYLLIELAQGSLPTNPPGDWPIYVDNEPTKPDDVITLYDADGRSSGRAMKTGYRYQHHGIQIRIRANTSVDLYVKANEIMMAVDRVSRVEVTIESSVYLVQNVSRTSDLIRFPPETSTSSRRIGVLNARVTLWKL